MQTRLAFAVAVAPMLVLVAGLPFVNRIDPVVFGLPFLLVWIVGWVMATPLFLGAAYLLVRGESDRPSSGDGL
jgi:Protein of unknown function (DUF3311)